MNLSREAERPLLDELSGEKAVELLPVSLYVLLMMVTGLAGNVLVGVFYSARRRTTPTTRLIVAVAVIDTVICLLMPKNIVDLSLSYKFTSSTLCKLNNFVNHTTAISSAFVLVAIAVFRFRAVCRPFASQFSMRHANISIAIAVTVATVFSIPVLVTHESVPINVTVNQSLTITGYDCNTSKKSSLKPLNLFVNILHFLIFGGSTSSFIALYSQMGVKIIRYYKTKRLLTSAHSTSEHTRTTDDNLTDKKPSHEGIDAVKTLRQETEDRNLEQKKAFSDDDQTAENSNEAMAGTNLSMQQVGAVEDDTYTGTDGKKYHYEDDHHDDKRHHDKTSGHEISVLAVKQTAMLCIITVIFVFSFLPYIVMNISRTLAKNKDGDDDFTNWIQFCTRSYLINSAANPFVYGLFNTEFRKFAKRVLCRPCRWCREG